MTASPLALKIARDIIGQITIGDLAPGAHLATAALARQFRVSRSPVREALKILTDQNIIEQQHNRGYFVGNQPPGVDFLGGAVGALANPDDVYLTFAEDWLNDRVASEVTELFIKERYGLTKSQTQDLLTRAAREGWAEPKPGYGWILRPVAKTTETFEQIYRFRAIIEPAALLEPTFAMNKAVCQALRHTQQKMLEGDAERLPPETLVAAGAAFHEELIKMSGNIMFFQALERANQLRRLMEYRVNVNRKRFVVQCMEHLQMLDMVERADNLEAAHFMRRHLTGALAAKSPLVHGRD